MSKSTITEESVRQIVNELEKAGTPVSVRNVRERLGAGSFETIQKYLTQLSDSGAPSPKVGAITPTTPVPPSPGAELLSARATIAAQQQTIDDQAIEIAELKQQIANSYNQTGEPGQAIAARDKQIATLKRQIIDLLTSAANQRRAQASGALDPNSEEAKRFAVDPDAMAARKLQALADADERHARRIKHNDQMYTLDPLDRVRTIKH